MDVDSRGGASAHSRGGDLDTEGFVRTSVDLDATWTPYDRAAAAHAVWHGVRGRTAVALASADGTRRATVGRSDLSRVAPDAHRNVVTFTIPEEEVRRRGLPGVEEAIAHCAAALASFSLGIASAADHENFPELFEEPPPPVPFNGQAWLHVVGAGAAVALDVFARHGRADSTPANSAPPSTASSTTRGRG